MVFESSQGCRILKLTRIISFIYHSSIRTVHSFDNIATCLNDDSSLRTIRWPRNIRGQSTTHLLVHVQDPTVLRHAWLTTQSCVRSGGLTIHAVNRLLICL